MMDSYDHHDPTTCPSNPIEPLFEGIDLTHHHHYKDTITNTATKQERSIDSDVDTQHHDVLPPSPSLSRSSSSLTLSDIEQDAYQQQRTTTTLAKPLKRKRKNTTSRQQQLQQQQRPRHRQKKQKQVRRHALGGSSTITTTTTTTNTLETTDSTLFEQLSYAGIDWCRYCGTTEGVNWRPGPWGKRTLCNKHGCDYKGYGLASRLPRLDLSGYRHELVQDRHRPVIQEFCSICQERGGNISRHYHNKTFIRMDDDDDDSDTDTDSEDDNGLVTCDGGCSRAFHRQCFHIDNNKNRQDLWFCSSTCADNRCKKRVVVDLPRKQPLMRPLK
ncbi:unnamed protein product [Absidia cylindrospora]